MRGVAVLILAAACAGPAPAQPPKLRAPAVITFPDWRSPPTRADISAVYPRSAQAARIPGAAVIRCRVSAAAVVSDCAVLMEAPPGEGFGPAVALTRRL